VGRAQLEALMADGDPEVAQIAGAALRGEERWGAQPD
jgi:hypothetical protein